MATGSRGGASKPNIFDAKKPPGNALLGKEVAAQKRQDAGLNPTASPVHAAGRAVHALVHGTGKPASASFGGAHINAPTAFTPVTLGLSTLLDLPKVVGGAHHQAVALAHPSAANPPGLGREVRAVLSGAVGFPRMGVDEPKPHPLLRQTPKPIAPYVSTDHEFVDSVPSNAATGVRGYVYHRTSVDALESIRKGGLKPSTPVGKGGGKDLPGVYFSTNPLTATRFANKGPGSVYLRASEAAIPDLRLHPNKAYGEMITANAVSPKALEYLGADGSWHPLVQRPEPTPTIGKGPAPTVNTLGQAVTGGLKGARGARGEQEIARSAERGARADAFAKALQANPTVEGAKQASKLLAGEYPKVRFSGFENFTPEAQSAMVKAISAHPELQEFQQKRAIDAVGKIIDGKVPTKGEEKLLRTAFGNATANDMMMSVSKFHQLRARGYDVLNIPRSVMASYDVSGIMRQALMIGTSHPLIWAKNVPDYIKAMKSEEVYNTGLTALHQRPNALNGVYEKMGLDFTELTPKGSAAAAREEAFKSTWAEKIPGVRMSGRGYTLFLDQARADVADLLYSKAVKQHRADDPKLLEDIGTVVNSESGRGDLGTGPIGRSQEGLNLLLFSPKLAKSRIDFLNPVWYAKLDPLARHEAYRAMSGLLVLTATAIGIGKAAGAKVNLDPRSSDFAKIKFGNTRIDLAGGFQQYTRILAEIATQQTVNAAGKVSHLGGGQGQTSDLALLMRFLRSKLAPIASAVTDVAAQRTAIGQPLTFNNSVVSRFTPLTGQDAVSVGKDVGGSNGIPAGVLAGIGAFGLSAVGAGVQNYTPKKPKVKGGNIFDQSPAANSGSTGKNIFDK